MSRAPKDFPPMKGGWRHWRLPYMPMGVSGSVAVMLLIAIAIYVILTVAEDYVTLTNSEEL